MLKASLDPAKSRVLISNDDGIDSHGLKLLKRAMRRLAADVWVVAPLHEQSGIGHSLTLRRPLRIRKRGRQRYAVDGTPTDAVLLAINHLMKDRPLDGVAGLRATRQGLRKLGDKLKIGHDPCGEPYYSIGSMRTELQTLKGSDLEAVMADAVSVTPLHLELTHHAFLRRLIGDMP